MVSIKESDWTDAIELIVNDCVDLKGKFLVKFPTLILYVDRVYVIFTASRFSVFVPGSRVVHF